jgi:hypothetical protein
VDCERDAIGSLKASQNRATLTWVIGNRMLRL